MLLRAATTATAGWVEDGWRSCLLFVCVCSLYRTIKDPFGNNADTSTYVKRRSDCINTLLMLRVLFSSNRAGGFSPVFVAAAASGSARYKNVEEDAKALLFLSFFFLSW